MKNRFYTVVAILILATPALSAQSISSFADHINKFGQALLYINKYYIDTVNNEKLVDKALKDLISQLDPHSSYLTKAEVKRINEPLEGNFEGVGIEFSIVRDTLTVVNPVSGGPSERVGIRAGDKIISVSGEEISSKELTNDKVHGYLRGAKGTRVRLGVVRRGVDKTLFFDVVRDKIPINSVDVMYEPADGILYIKLSRFSATSAQEILSRVKGKESKYRGVILDLRGNSGGYLGTAFDITNMFLQRGEMVVYTHGRGVPSMEERANGNGVFKKERLAVLIDERSASASEILAGAVQDWDRGVIVGRRSFGKGLVQQMMPLQDGSELRLTIAQYHTPSGRVIQSPYEEGEADKYYRELNERYRKGEYFSSDSIAFPDSLKYYTLKERRVVYGGGGIMPDIFIPADTTGYSDYYAKLVRGGIFNDFMSDIADQNRELWKNRYGDYNIFNLEFIVDDNIIEKMVNFAKERGIEPNRQQLEVSRYEISIIIKAFAARSIFGDEGYYRVINFNNDPAFERALMEVSGY